MKKIIIVGFIILLSLTGCEFVNMGTWIKNVDSEYQFNTYEAFLKIKEAAINDENYFVIDQTETMETTDLIDLKMVFEDVEVLKEDRSNIEVHYFAVYDPKDDKHPTFDIKTKEIFMYHVKWQKFSGKANGMMLVKVPKSFNSKLLIDTVSGEIDVKDQSIDQLTVETVSGDISLESIDAGKIDINSVSGQVEYSEGDVETFSVDTVSGDINLDDVAIEQMNIDSTSGDIILESSDIAEAIFDTVSGNIKLEIKAHRGDIVIESTSGDVRIETNDWDASVHFESTSGKFSTELPFSQMKTDGKDVKGIIGSGTYRLDVDTTSGSLTLK